MYKHQVMYTLQSEVPTRTHHFRIQVAWHVFPENRGLLNVVHAMSGKNAEHDPYKLYILEALVLLYPI